MGEGGGSLEHIGRDVAGQTLLEDWSEEERMPEEGRTGTLHAWPPTPVSRGRGGGRSEWTVDTARERCGADRRSTCSGRKVDTGRREVDTEGGKSVRREMSDSQNRCV